MINSYSIIGIDGGATKVSGVDVNTADNQFLTGNFSCEQTYAIHPNIDPQFQPVQLDIQLAEFESQTLNISESELIQGAVYIESTTHIINKIYQQIEQTPVLVGIGMPGLKTVNGRGIAVMANGPRIPDFIDRLTDLLSREGIDLLSSITQLGDDAFYCGIGEEYSQDGKFSAIANAYYIGGGTGVADVIKLDGKVYSFDTIKDWMVKTWEIKTDDNIGLEDYLSARGIAQSYNQINHANVHAGIVMERALISDSSARQIFETSGTWLGRLICERMTTLHYGISKNQYFTYPLNTEYSADHKFIGGILDRVVIGQRLGQLLDTNDRNNPFWKSFIFELDRLLTLSEILSAEIKKHYLDALHNDLIHVSLLRSAPAIGAGISAQLRYTSRLASNEK